MRVRSVKDMVVLQHAVSRLFRIHYFITQIARVGNSLFGFSSESLFLEQKTESRANHSLCLFFKDRWKQFVHGCSFVKSDGANCSRSLFFKERIAHSHSIIWTFFIKRAKSEFPTLDFYLLLKVLTVGPKSRGVRYLNRTFEILVEFLTNIENIF